MGNTITEDLSLICCLFISECIKILLSFILIIDEFHHVSSSVVAISVLNVLEGCNQKPKNIPL